MTSDDPRTRSLAQPASSPEPEPQTTRIVPDCQTTPAPKGRFEESILPPGAQVAGRYRVLEVLGVGGMGVVYKAHDEMLDLDLALKVLRPEIALDAGFLQRFRNELVLARQVSHRHVVSNYDLGVHEGMHFITMDLVTGRSLDDVLREKGKLSLEDSIRIVRQVAGALAEAHRQGIVHRDLKPANILLDDGGDAYVTDFGIARSLGSGLTRTGEILGTPDYLSPEQARGERVDGRSDVFTLGIIFIQLLSGKLPFPGGTLLEVVAQRMAGGVLSLEELGLEVSPTLAKVIERCVDKDPEKRYPSADLLVEALAEVDRPRKQRGLSVRTLAWAAAALLAVGVGAYFLGREAVPESGGGAVPAGGAPAAAGGPEAPPPAAALPVPAPRHSLAVLPFPEATGSGQMAWAANGVAEMLARALAEHDDLRVVESVRVFQILRDLGFQAQRLRVADLEQLAELLRVDRLVFGDLRARGDQIQLAMSLLEADLPGSPTRLVVTQRGAVRELFELVDKLAASLRDALEVAAPAQASLAPLTPSAAALQAYAEGLENLSSRETLQAAPLLERAVAEDPAFATAWVRLSQAYQSLGRLDDALAAAGKAVEATRGTRGRIVYEALAQEALVRGKPEEAQRFLEDLVQRYPNDTGARIALAEAYGQQGSFAAATSRLEEVVAIDPSPRAWYLLGRYSIESGDNRPAVDKYLAAALEQQKKLHNQQGEAEVYNALGVGYERLGELDLAAASYDTAAATYREIGDRRGLATSLHNLGVIGFLRGDFETSKSNIQTALEIHQEMGNVAGVAELYNLQGAFEEERGRYPEALDYYRRALKERTGLGDERALAESHNNVGYVYYLLGEYDNALLYLERAIELYRANEDQHGITVTLESIGFCQLAQGAWPAATRSFVESLELSRETGERLATAVALENLGLIARYQGRFAAAFSSFEDSLAILKELEDSRGQVEIAMHEAAALNELGRYERAELKLEEVEDDLVEGNRAQHAAWQALRGETLLRRGALDEAETALAEAETEAEASQSAVSQVEVHIVQGLLALAAERTDGAREVLEPALSEADRLGNAILQLRAAEGLARAELLAGNLDAAEDLLRKALRTSAGGGTYARSYRLHQLLAAVLRQQGDAQAAADSLDKARAELARVRQNLDDDLRPSFDQLAEVRDLL